MTENGNQSNQQGGNNNNRNNITATVAALETIRFNTINVRNHAVAGSMILRHNKKALVSFIKQDYLDCIKICNGILSTKLTPYVLVLSFQQEREQVKREEYQTTEETQEEGVPTLDMLLSSEDSAAVVQGLIDDGDFPVERV